MYQRFLFIGAGLLIWGLVGAAVWVGWHPAPAHRIRKAEHPFTFWTTIALGLIFGAVLVHIGFFV